MKRSVAIPMLIFAGICIITGCKQTTFIEGTAVNRLLVTASNNRTKTVENHEKFMEMTIADKILSESIAKTLKIAIEDHIWFWGENSRYDSLIGQDFQYEYLYDERNECAVVLFLLQEKYDKRYNMIMLSDNDDMFTNDISLSWGSLDDSDYEAVKRHYMPNQMELGSIRIEEADKPNYDASQAQIEETTRKIMEDFNRGFQTKNITDIYIRHFYDVSEETIIVYYSNDTGNWCFANADLSGRVYKPTRVDDEILCEYVQRILECSYLVK